MHTAMAGAMPQLKNIPPRANTAHKIRQVRAMADDGPLGLVAALKPFLLEFGVVHGALLFRVHPLCGVHQLLLKDRVEVQRHQEHGQTAEKFHRPDGLRVLQKP